MRPLEGAVRARKLSKADLDDNSYRNSARGSESLMLRIFWSAVISNEWCPLLNQFRELDLWYDFPQMKWTLESDFSMQWEEEKFQWQEQDFEKIHESKKKYAFQTRSASDTNPGFKILLQIRIGRFEPIAFQYITWLLLQYAQWLEHLTGGGHLKSYIAELSYIADLIWCNIKKIFKIALPEALLQFIF